MRYRFAASALLPFAALLLSTATAHSATVTGTSTQLSASYSAAAGEVNNVTISATYTRASRQLEVTLRDAGVPVVAVVSTPGEVNPCGLGSAPNIVVCRYQMTDGTLERPGASFVLDADLGDGNDKLIYDASTAALGLTDGDTVFTSHFGLINAGDGADTLTDQADGGYRPFLAGGAGTDVLRGGPGDNHLYGGPGNDSFFGYEGADDIVGDTGTDTVSYRDGRSAGGVLVRANDEGVSPTVSAPRSGNAVDFSATGDVLLAGDFVAGVENVAGTAYDDVLIGNAANNLLAGTGGRDQLLGGAGNDTLTVTGAPGKLYGGAGNDTLNARNGAADSRLDCGPGSDVANLDLIDTGWIGCESTVRQ